MLQSVIRPSIVSSRIAVPVNSSAKPVPPAVPISPITAKAISLAVAPPASRPVTSTRKFFIFRWIKHCVAITCSTSDVPIPCASAPAAPCVEVWESPHTTVIPGSTAPCSGPMTCTIPCRTSFSGISTTSKDSQLSSRVCNWTRDTASGNASKPASRSLFSVETL